MNPGKLFAELENLIDKHSMRAVLFALAEIASEKAAHVLTNWQDENLSKVWEKVSGKINTVAHATIV